MEAKDFLKSLPVLEPLCRATENTLEPTKLFNNDYLEVDMDDEGSRFVVQAVVYRVMSPLCNCKCKLRREDEIPASGNAKVKWVERVPEHHSDKVNPNKWVLAATDFTCLVMAHQWPEEKIVFLSDMAKTMYHFLLKRFLLQTKNAVIGAQFKLEKRMPEMPKHYIPHPNPDLRAAPYQEVPVAMCTGAEAFALYMQQGTGKTIVSIARLCTEARMTRLGLFGEKRMMRVLIVCPRQARKNWQDEIERFATVPGKTVVLRGEKWRRIKGVVDAIRQEDDCEFGACICSYQSVDGTWSAIGTVPWDLVIIDEGHYIKGPNVLRSKSCRKLRETSQRRMELTGTPVVNTVLDLWAQHEFLGEGMSGFLTFKNYKTFYGKFERLNGGRQKGGGVERLVGMKNLPLVQERLARISFSITKKEAGLNLPEKAYDIYEVQMSKKQTEYYRKLQSQLALEIEADKSLTAEHILTRLLRLAQITSGHVKWDATYTDEGEVETAGRVEQIERTNNKMDAVLDMLEEDWSNDPNQKIIIWAIFREDIRLIHETLNKKGIKHVLYYGGVKDKDRDGMVTQFNKDPECKVFVGNPMAAAEALNLLGYDYSTTKAEDAVTYTGHEIFFSQNWSPALRSQAEDRAHRRGTKMQVRITDLMVIGTIDEEIRQVVSVKRQNAMAIQDIKELMQRVLQTEVEVEVD